MRALESVLIVKARESLPHRPLPKHLITKHKPTKVMKKVIKSRKVLMHIIRKMKRAMRRMARKAVKKCAGKTVINVANWNNKKKAALKCKKKAAKVIRAALKKLHKHLVKRVGHRVAKHIAKIVVKSAKASVRRVIRKEEKVHPSKALSKLKKIGRKVNKTITHEAHAAG